MHEQRMKQLNKDYEKQEKAIRLAKVYNFNIDQKHNKRFWGKISIKNIFIFRSRNLTCGDVRSSSI